MIRAGSGDAVVLLHGVTGSERMWTRVIPLLSADHDVIALTALGHCGGRAHSGRVSIADVVDDAERALDELGLSRPHLVGNSMGGWVALELARRGRARTVCALSPAGCWNGTADRREASDRLRAIARFVRLTRAVMPLAARSPPLRRWVMRDIAEYGERLSLQEAIGLADDLLACSARDDLLGTTDQLAPLNPLPCPVVLAWAACDRILPAAIHGRRARELMPEAAYIELPNVGHVPMVDDPQLVAATILQTTRLDQSAGPSAVAAHALA